MIVVLNFGSQFAHLIARRIRDLGVRAEIFPFDVALADIMVLRPSGIILSGGPASVLSAKHPTVEKKLFDLGIPILGICYGEQLMASVLGGVVKEGTTREYGKEEISILKRTGIFKDLKSSEAVWFSHGDVVTDVPEGFVVTARTEQCPIAAFAHVKKKLYGVQFHPEVTHTQHGNAILSQFIFGICGSEKDWNIATQKQKIQQSIIDSVGDKHVLIGVSGGVDSLVAAVLLYQALGAQVHAVFVDTGMLRENEVDEVVTGLKEQEVNNLDVINASSLFLSRLRHVLDPEEKRKIIGHTFIDVFEKHIRKTLKSFPIRFFAQGTIYPDRIESAQPSAHASKIKSHHNLSIPDAFGFSLLEPLRDLYKDEVRKLGISLGLPKELLYRHPFPGPGLGVRIVGEVTRERIALLSRADAIFREELKTAGEYEKIWQAFAALLPIKTVGVMGDARTYEYIVALRAVDSVDGMSADWHRMPHRLLEKISSRITREVRGVNRVLYDITQKPPATIEYE